MCLWTKGKCFPIISFCLIDTPPQDGGLYDGKVPTVLATCIGFLLAGLENQDS